ncbi:MAG: hypothetical protein ACK5X9_18810 [Alphaproteobacteria bacterium]
MAVRVIGSFFSCSIPFSSAPEAVTRRKAMTASLGLAAGAAIAIGRTKLVELAGVKRLKTRVEEELILMKAWKPKKVNKP